MLPIATTVASSPERTTEARPSGTTKSSSGTSANSALRLAGRKTTGSSLRIAAFNRPLASTDCSERPRRRRPGSSEPGAEEFGMLGGVGDTAAGHGHVDQRQADAAPRHRPQLGGLVRDRIEPRVDEISVHQVTHGP